MIEQPYEPKLLGAEALEDLEDRVHRKVASSHDCLDLLFTVRALHAEVERLRIDLAAIRAEFQALVGKIEADFA
jgi:hypothetical protein